MKLSSKTIAAHWPLTAVRILCRLKGKDERATCQVTAREGTFALKVAHPRRDEGLVRRDTAVLDVVGRQRFPAPRLLPTMTGHRYARLGNRLVYAMEWIEGKTPEASVENWRRIGKLIGRLHTMKPPRHLPTDFTVESQRKKMLARARTYGMESQYFEMVQHLPRFADAPRSLIHTDVGLRNVVAKPNGMMMLVDWDDAGVGPTVLDIGYVLTNFLTSQRVFKQTHALAFFRTYSKVRRIRNIKKRYAIDAGLFFALAYSVHATHGIDGGYWRWTKYIAEHRSIFDSVLQKF